MKCSAIDSLQEACSEKVTRLEFCEYVLSAAVIAIDIEYAMNIV